MLCTTQWIILGERRSRLFRDAIYDGASDPVVIWNQQEKNWWLLYTHAWGAGVPACVLHAAQPRRGTPNGILRCVEGAVASGDAAGSSR